MKTGSRRLLAGRQAGLGSTDDGFDRNGTTRSLGMGDRSARRTCVKNRFACVGVWTTSCDCSTTEKFGSQRGARFPGLLNDVHCSTGCRDPGGLQ